MLLDEHDAVIYFRAFECMSVSTTWHNGGELHVVSGNGAAALIFNRLLQSRRHGPIKPTQSVIPVLFITARTPFPISGFFPS